MAESWFLLGKLCKLYWLGKNLVVLTGLLLRLWVLSSPEFINWLQNNCAKINTADSYEPDQTGLERQTAEVIPAGWAEKTRSPHDQIVVTVMSFGNLNLDWKKIPNNGHNCSLLKQWNFLVDTILSFGGNNRKRLVARNVLLYYSYLGAI